MNIDKKTLVFDTNGINALQDDEKQQEIIGRFKAGFTVKVTETSIVELAATRCPARREKLFDLLQSLIPLGGCIMPHHWIISEMARCHARYKDRFEWADVDVRCPELEKEILDRTFVSSNESAEDNRAWGKVQDKAFQAILREARLKFVPEFENQHDRRGSEQEDEKLSVNELIEILKAGDGPFWSHVADVYEGANLIPLSKAAAKYLIERCPPFHALTLATFVAQYNDTIPTKRGEKKPPSAGRADLFMATYLPYCEYFISNDSGVLKDLRIIAAEVKLPVEIIPYRELLERL